MVSVGSECVADQLLMLTFPTAASPSRTSLTLLLGLGAAAPVVSLMVSAE